MILRRTASPTLLTIVLAAALLSGCGPSSTTPNGVLTNFPVEGTYFLFQRTEIDSAGRVVSIDTTKEMFRETGVNRFGKDDVTIVVDSTFPNGTFGTPSVDSSFFHFEPNGDVSIHPPINGDELLSSHWVTYPFASQGSHTTTMENTDPNEGPIVETITADGAGSGTVTIGGESFFTQRVSLTITFSSNGKSQTIHSTGDFAPALGFIVRTEQPDSHNSFSGKMDNAVHGIVVGYHLRK